MFVKFAFRETERNVWFHRFNSTATIFHENFLFFFFAGRRRVSLGRSPQLNNCPTSASSHYSSICKLSLVIPVILLLLSTTIDVTGKWFMLKFTSTFFFCCLFMANDFYVDCMPFVGRQLNVWMRCVHRLRHKVNSFDIFAFKMVWKRFRLKEIKSKNDSNLRTPPHSPTVRERNQTTWRASLSISITFLLLFADEKTFSFIIVE